jgi:hypothetical protein
MKTDKMSYRKQRLRDFNKSNIGNAVPGRQDLVAETEKEKQWHVQNE